MNPDLPKICADSLRDDVREKYGVKLKASHAHELVAAYFGYKSRNAMLADTEYPVSKLPHAEFVVMTPDSFIDERRRNLEGIPEGLPDSYVLGEAVYTALFANNLWDSATPPYRSFRSLAAVFHDKNEAFRSLFKLSPQGSMHHVLTESILKDEVILTVFHAHEMPTDETMVDGKTVIRLQRSAGKIGYESATMSSPEKWTAGARRSLRSLGISPLKSQ